jgi:hypothetical protein
MIQWTYKIVTILQFLVQTNLKKFGDKIGKGLVSKCAIKSGSHLNLSLSCEIGAKHNDAIVLWNTFVTCSWMSKNHYFNKRTSKIFF